MTSREFAIIERYFKSLSPPGDGVIIGPGDDCAVLSVPDGHQLCVSTDTLIEGVHFLKDSAPDVVVARVMGANLSDLAAMGATPYAFLLAATLPDVSDGWLLDFSKALSAQIERHKIPLVGGNLARGALSLTVTVLGTVPAGAAVTRAGSAAGDHVYVTGSLGDAAMGLQLCRAGETAGYLVDRYNCPQPRLAAGERLRGLATSMIDISDGLVAEVGHLAEQGRLGAEIQASLLPLSPELVERAGAGNAVRLALFAGDDYELCFTVNPDKSGLVDKLSASLGLPMTRVGIITTTGEVVVRNKNGEPMPFESAGYQHF